MIIRILGEGQFDLPDDAMFDLNALDGEVTAAIDALDESAFRASLGKLLETVRGRGSALPGDYLGPSELILPAEDATVEEVTELLTDEGLIPD